MPSKVREKFEDIKDKAFELALIPVEFVLNPLALHYLKKMHIRREIAKDVLISSDWTILSLKPSIKIEKRFQEIILNIEDYEGNVPSSVDDGFEENEPDLSKVILQDGTVLNPQVQIMSRDGNKYDLEFGYRVKTVGFKSKFGELPKDKKYIQIRIRCDRPFLCKKVIWHDYTLK